jgi:hypothetical protein
MKKIFVFLSGVTIDITKDKILATATNYSNSISFENLDNFRYNESQKNRLSPIGLMSRSVALSFFLMIFNKVLSFNVPNLSDILFFSGLILFGITVLSFFAFVFDVFLEFRIFDYIISNYFSDKGYFVIIGNKSGNNIEFYARIEDLSMIQELEGVVYIIKNEHKSNTKNDNKPNEGYLDELKKLGELFREGILTENEFNNKKQELLNNKKV